MVESLQPSITPHELLAIKDGILEQWQRLPTEHQASMFLVLLNDLLHGEYGPWTTQAIHLLAPLPETALLASQPPRQGPAIFHEDLAHHTALSPTEIAQLSSADLEHISAVIFEHLVEDVLWDEVEYQVRLHLDAKR